MRQALVFLALGIIAGVGMAAFFGRSPLPAMQADPQTSSLSTSRQTRLVDRVAALEAELAEEKRQREALTADLSTLASQIGSVNESAVDNRNRSGRDESGASSENPAMAAAGESASTERIEARMASRRERASPEYRRDRLIEAGFPADQAQWIIDREAQMRLDMLNAQYEARREGEPFNPLAGQREAQTQMREQLGETAYAQYLEATGQPTSVPVREVIANSPAQAAGLQSGDEIVSYGGERVFNMIELNELTLGGEPGETVVVDILRNGQPMQLYIPRGPIGFSGGRGNFAFGPVTIGP